MSSTKSRRLNKAEQAIRSRLTELKARPIPSEIRYAFASLSNDGQFNQAVIFGQLPKGLDHKLIRVNDIRMASVQNYAWGSNPEFPINNSSVDFLSGLVLEFTVSAPSAISCIMPSADAFFRDISLRIGTSKLVDIRKNVIHQYNLTNDNYQDYLRKTRLEEDMLVPGTKIDRGTGGTNAAVTFYLDLTPFICDKQWLPISRKLMSNEIYLTLNIDARERIMDTGGSSETCTITDMRLHQSGYVDSESYYINMIKGLLNEDLPIIMSYRYFDNEDVPITSIELTHHLNFINRSMVEQILFNTVAATSYTDLNYNPETDSEEVDTLRLEYNGARFYPNRSDAESHIENVILKRVVGHVHGRNYYKLTFGDQTIEKTISTSSPALSNSTINLNYSQTKPSLHLTSTTIGSHLNITAVSKRMLKLNKDGSVRIFES